MALSVSSLLKIPRKPSSSCTFSGSLVSVTSGVSSSFFASLVSSILVPCDASSSAFFGSSVSLVVPPQAARPSTNISDNNINNVFFFITLSPFYSNFKVLQSIFTPISQFT